MQATDKFRDVTFRCRAFRCERIRLNTVRVYANGDVLVYDELAKHFTTCHILGRAAKAKAKQLATA